MYFIDKSMYTKPKIFKLGKKHILKCLSICFSFPGKGQKGVLTNQCLKEVNPKYSRKQ